MQTCSCSFINKHIFHKSQSFDRIVSTKITRNSVLYSEIFAGFVISFFFGLTTNFPRIFFPFPVVCQCSI